MLCCKASAIVCSMSSARRFASDSVVVKASCASIGSDFAVGPHGLGGDEDGAGGFAEFVAERSAAVRAVDEGRSLVVTVV